jgi:hypothetical protein
VLPKSNNTLNVSRGGLLPQKAFPYLYLRCSQPICFNLRRKNRVFYQKNFFQKKPEKTPKKRETTLIERGT